MGTKTSLLHQEASGVVRLQSEVGLCPLQKPLQKVLCFPRCQYFILLCPQLQGGQHDGDIERVKHLKAQQPPPRVPIQPHRQSPLLWSATGCHPHERLLTSLLPQPKHSGGRYQHQALHHLTTGSQTYTVDPIEDLDYLLRRCLRVRTHTVILKDNPRARESNQGIAHHWNDDCQHPIV